MKRIASLFLAGVLSLFCFSNVPISALEAPDKSPSVIYLNGSEGNDSNSGTDPKATVATLEKAYQKLLTLNSDLENDETAFGTIVISGPVILNDHFNKEGTIKHKGTISIVSKFQGVDYRADNSAKLSIGTPRNKEEMRFQCPGPTVFNHIVIERPNQANGKAASSLTFYTSNYFMIGEDVETRNTNWGEMKLEEGLSSDEAESLKLSAHRGFRPAAPENSLPAFRAAGEAGFWAIETDVQRTSDGVLVCCHNDTIDDMFNGSGKISEMTLAELYQYQIDKVDMGGQAEYTLEQYTAEELRIPLFSEYLEICKKYGALPFIEVKGAPVEAIIEEAKQYFAEENIIISSSNYAHMEEAREVSDKVFIHHIFSEESKIESLAALGNSGMAFDYDGAALRDPVKYAEAKRLVDKAHAAGVKVCLRAGDDLGTVKKMSALGIDYIPTNTTTKANATESTYQPVAGSGGKIFIRGGYGYQDTTEDISITLLSGQYDFVSGSNAKAATNGNYSLTLGGTVFVSRLIAGSTCSKSGQVQVDKSENLVKDNGYVKEFYTVGDYNNVKNTEVCVSGGIIESMVGCRSGKSGQTENVSVTIQEQGSLPQSVGLNNAYITGSKNLIISGVVGSMAFTEDWNSILLKDNSCILLIGDYPESVPLTIEPGSRLLDKPMEPPVIIKGNNGKWIQGSSFGLTFQSDADLMDFISVSVDNQLLIRNQDYTVAEEVTLITLKSEYLSALALGEHNIKILSENGEAQASFSVVAKEKPSEEDSGKEPEGEPEQNSSSNPSSEGTKPSGAVSSEQEGAVEQEENVAAPNTGDRINNTWFYFAVVLLSTSGVGLLLVVDKKRCKKEGKSFGKRN